MLQRIIVGLDGSARAEQCLSYVCGLATGAGSSVVLLRVIQIPVEYQQESYQEVVGQLVEQAKAQASTYLNGIEQRLRSEGVAVKSLVRAGDAATEIIRAAQQEEADLIALTTHGYSAGHHSLRGSVAEKVLDLATVPLLLVRPDQGASAALTRLVVALDGSPLAATALPYAEEVAARLKLPVTLLGSVEATHQPDDPTMGIPSEYDRMQAALRSGVEAYLDATAAGLRSRAALLSGVEAYLNATAAGLRSMGLTVDTIATVGHSAEEIVEYSDAHPGSLVVMTTHGQSGQLGPPIGSVARSVAQAETPVLLIG